MLIAQITDTHIGFERDTGGDKANRVRLEKTLARLLDGPNRPDMLVLSGDLTEHGDAESFAELAGMLVPCPVPVLPMVGNHDDRAALRAAFPGTPVDEGFIHYSVERDGLNVILLDTFEPGRHGGAFCDRRRDWLRAQLDAETGTPAVIFMHHPPIVSGIDWMDPRPDERWIANFAAAVAGHEGRIHAIHCGHLHRPVSTRFAGIPLSVTPSVAPHVALDLRDIDETEPDGRALITSEGPAYALHRWNGETLVTHYEKVDDWDVVASYDRSLQPMIQGMLAERE